VICVEFALNESDRYVILRYLEVGPGDTCECN